jgi:hypothetical protein
MDLQYQQKAWTQRGQTPSAMRALEGIYSRQITKAATENIADSYLLPSQDFI